MEKLNKKELVEKIISRLGELSPLPEDGFMSGGAVANTILSLYWGGKYPINDIDIFVEVKNKNVNTPIRYNEHTLSEDGYGHTRVNNIDNNSYRVIETERDGLINTVKYTFEPEAIMKIGTILNGSGLKPEQKKEKLLSILKGFDINCCQVGIDLKTKELIYTKEFSDFLDTKQLKASTLYTPGHTAIRMFKKLDELKCFCNIDQEMKKLSYFLLDTFSYYPYVATFFGEKYKDLYHKYEKGLNQYFELVGFIEKKTIDGEGVTPETWEKYEGKLWSFKVVKHKDELTDLVCKITIPSTPLMMKKHFNLFEGGLSKKKMEKVKLIMESRKLTSLLYMVDGFYDCDFSPKHIAQLDLNFVGFDTSPEMNSEYLKRFFAFVIAKQMNLQQFYTLLVVDVKHLKNKHGDWIIDICLDVLEDFVLFNDEYNTKLFNKRVEESIITNSFNLIDPIDIPKMDSLPDDVKIYEISTNIDLYREGHILKNCLRSKGQNYKDKIIKGEYRVFKIVTPLSMSALELKLHNGLYFTKEQHLAKANKKISEYHKLIGDILMYELNKYLLSDLNIATQKLMYNNVIGIKKSVLSSKKDTCTKNNPTDIGLDELFPPPQVPIVNLNLNEIEIDHNEIDLDELF